ncbi:hypothetical protein KJ980_00555 [Patescibacteria group bacterium]|nr:hypothetical protein [Patescibacteria group bacterium]MBU4098119.1 hypothetical protein [Patescibacteria group bacterium]
MARVEALQSIKQENIGKFKPITVLDVAKKWENNSDKLKLSIPEKIRYVLWTEAVSTGDEGFGGELIIKSWQLGEKHNTKNERLQPVSRLTVQVKPYSEADEIAIKNFHKRIEDATKRYEEHKHPLSHVPDTTDYSINHIDIFKRFYLEGLDGTLPERK